MRFFKVFVIGIMFAAALSINAKVLEGDVVDKEQRNPLEFANVSLLHHNVATI